MLLLKLYSSVFYDYKFVSAVLPEKNMFDVRLQSTLTCIQVDKNRKYL